MLLVLCLQERSLLLDDGIIACGREGQDFFVCLSSRCVGCLATYSMRPPRVSLLSASSASSRVLLSASCNWLGVEGEKLLCNSVQTFSTTCTKGSIPSF